MKKIIICFLSVVFITLPAMTRADVMKRYTMLTEGQDLKPHLGQMVEITAVVSNTKHPSFGNYWLTVQELDGLQGKKVHVRGKLIQRKETTRSPNGAIVQGRD